MIQGTSGLWTPRADAHEFRKEAAPNFGPSFGPWSGRDLTYTTLPGGSVVQFDLSRLTIADYREMRSHYQVSYDLTLLMFMLHQMDWSIESTDKAKAAVIEDIMRPVWTRLIRAVSQAHWAGFSPIVPEWDNDPINGRVIVSKFKDLVPEDCSVNWKTIEGVASRPGGVRPKLYEYDGIKQFAWGEGGGAYIIPPEYTLWYPMLMENGDFYGRKLLKSAFVPWFFSILVHLFANRYFERFGEPVPIGRADFDTQVIDSNGTSLSGRDAMFQILENLRSRGVVVLPNDSTDMGNGRREYDFDIKYLESQMRGADFERYLLRLDEEISLGMFTPVSLSHVGDNASHNTVQVHMQGYLWMLNALAYDMKEYIDRYVIERLKNWNFGPKAPRIEWRPRPFGRDNVETLRAIVAAGIGRTQDWALKPNVDQLSTALGLDFEEVEILQEPTPIPGATGADPRVNRQRESKPKIAKTGDPGVVRSKMAARVKRQAERAHYSGNKDFRPDWGHRVQLEDAVGPERAEFVMSVLDAWAPEAWASSADHNDFNAKLDRVLEYQLGKVDD
jgi:hypothetical protein